MSTRTARADMHSLYGHGVGSILSQRGGGSPSAIPEDEEMIGMPSGSGQLVMKLRRKRQTALLKEILKSGGYEDLARMTSFKRE